MMFNNHTDGIIKTPFGSFQKQDVRKAYAYFFPEQECDRVSVHV